MTCGHATCKKCLVRDITGVCKKCKTKYNPIEEDPIDVEPYIKVCILTSELVGKYWSRELESTRIRSEGNRLFQRGCVEESIVKYSQAIEKCPEDYLSHSNISNANPIGESPTSEKEWLLLPSLNTRKPSFRISNAIFLKIIVPEL